MRYTSALLIASAWVASAHADAIDVGASSLERMANRLVQRWAPVYVQHVADDDEGADRPTRIDFDGDWDTTNNWDRQEAYGTQLPPAAYAAGVMTATHAYLTYTLYYPRDWASPLCVPLICHDNDLETVQLVVERDAGDGHLVEVRAKAHASMSTTDGTAIARTEDDRPKFKVESHGHGISVCRQADPDCDATDGRIVYAPGAGPSVPPKVAAGQTVRYELLSLRDSLWARRGLAHERLWTSGETGPLYYRGKHRGRLGQQMGASMAGSRYLGGVRPPWALKGPGGQRGDWFLDPAATREPNARYVYNPFLDDLDAECRGAGCAPGPAREPTRLEYFAKLAAPYLALSLGLVVAGGLLRHREAEPRFARRTPSR
ncbi:MAG: hypothetical protein AB7P03_11565 [Kofleriaceae bacterium]